MPWMPWLIGQAIYSSLHSANGDMEAIEGPNECDVFGQCGGGGSLGIANSLAFLPILQYAAQTLNVPLVAPSLCYRNRFRCQAISIGSSASTACISTSEAATPGASVGDTMIRRGTATGVSISGATSRKSMLPACRFRSAKPAICRGPPTSAPFTVPENVTASYIPRTLLLAFKHGFDKTFFYQLIDDPTSPQGYGLLRNDFSEKPGFTALKNMLNLALRSGCKQLHPGSLPFEISSAATQT